MKTSFYFVLWIAVYPLLDLLNNEFVTQNAFFVALIIVFAVSWLINRIMPSIIGYEQVMQVAPLLEDLYNCNFEAIQKRVSRDATINLIWSIYLVLNFLFFGYIVISYHAPFWFPLIIFGLLAIGSITTTAKMMSANSLLKSGASPESILEKIEEVYHLNYSAYYESRQFRSYDEILSPTPRGYKAFRIISALFACAAAILGVVFLVYGISCWFDGNNLIKALSTVNILYGSLAIYFGVKDLMDIRRTFNKSRL